VAKVPSLNLHQDGLLLSALDVILIDEVDVLLPILILGNNVISLFYTGLYPSKYRFNIITSVILVVVRIQRKATSVIMVLGFTPRVN